MGMRNNNYRPRSMCSCIYAGQGAYAAVGQGAYCAAVCRARSVCSCMQGREHVQLYMYAGQGACAAVCMQGKFSDYELNESHEMPMCFVHIFATPHHFRI